MLREAELSCYLKRTTYWVGRALESRASQPELQTVRGEFLIREAQWCLRKVRLVPDPLALTFLASAST